MAPQGGIYKSWGGGGGGGGGGYRAFGELGRNGPLRNQQIAINTNSPGCSSGWRVAYCGGFTSVCRWYIIIMTRARGQ